MTAAIDDESPITSPNGLESTGIARLFAFRSASRDFLAKPLTRRSLERVARSLRNIYGATVVAIATPDAHYAFPSRALKPQWHLAKHKLCGEVPAGGVLVLRGADLTELSRDEATRSAIVASIAPADASSRGFLLLGFPHSAEVDDDERMALTLIGDELAAALGSTKSAIVAQPNNLSRTRDDFLALLAHELRTPLTPMAMLLHVIEKKARSGVVDLDAIGRVNKQVARLTRLIANLLDPARFEAEACDGPWELLNLGALASEVVRSFQKGSRGHRISLSLPLAPIHVVGDRAALEQVFVNLLDNAVKFSPRGGEICVEARCTETHVRFAISDQGIGVPKRERARIFQRLFRANNASVDNHRGLGLGLPLARAIVRKHGGSIEVRSLAGRGSRFTITLPLATGETETESPRTPRVMLVDDDADIVEVLADILRIEGFDVVAAHDGSEALTQMQTWRPDLLLLDLMMPTTNGWEVLARLRAQPDEPRIPVIVLSAHASPPATDEHPFDAYLKKPFDVQALVHTMRKLLGPDGSASKANGRTGSPARS